MTVQEACDIVKMYKKNILLGGENTLCRNDGYENVIRNIKRLISEKGMKQGVVAERAGFTPQEFSHILNGRRKLLRVEYVIPIAEALGVEANDLYADPAETGKEVV